MHISAHKSYILRYIKSQFEIVFKLKSYHFKYLLKQKKEKKKH